MPHITVERHSETGDTRSREPSVLSREGSRLLIALAFFDLSLRSSVFFGLCSGDTRESA
jgi:hypothetical protein